MCTTKSKRKRCGRREGVGGRIPRRIHESIEMQKA